VVNKLKIISSIYQVKYVTELKDYDDNLYGEITPNKLEIHINKTYPIERQLQTILHEGIHGVDFEMKLGISKNETNLERLSNGIFAFLIDNKKFINEIIN